MSTKCSKEEIDILITACTVRRYSTKESMNFLKKHKIEISERTFYNKKNELKIDLGKRTRCVLESLLSEHLNRIDELNQVDKELWKMIENTNDSNLKIKILNSITNVQNQISEFVEKTLTMIEKQQQWFYNLPIGDKVNVEKFLEKKKEELSIPFNQSPPMFIDTSPPSIEELNQERKNRLKSFIEDEKIDSL